MSESESAVVVRENNQGSEERSREFHFIQWLRKNDTPDLQVLACLFLVNTIAKKNFQCAKFLPLDALRFRKKLYGVCEKQVQDQFVSRCIEHGSVKRQRPRKQHPGVEQLPSRKPHAFSTVYNFPTTQGKIKVCKKCFLHLTKFSVERVRHVLKILTSGCHFVEKRGGDRVSDKSAQKKESVRQFIGFLHAEESHYNRLKSKRLYLQSGTSIRRLREAYNDSVIPSMKVSKTMFRNIFSGEFNIVFKSPASDIAVP